MTRFTPRSKSWPIAFALLAFQVGAIGQAFAQPVKSIKAAPTRVAAEYTLVSIELGERETCFVFCLTEPDRDVTEYRQFDGEFIFTAPPGRYVALVYGGDKPRPPTRVEIRRGTAPGPDPPVPPPPVPPVPPPPVPPSPVRPEGLAGEVFDRVPAVSPSAHILAVARCFRDTANGIANARAWQAAQTQAERDKVPAPKIFQSTTAAEMCAAWLAASGVDANTWKPVYEYVYREMDKAKMSLDKVREICEATALGLEASSRR